MRTSMRTVIASVAVAALAGLAGCSSSDGGSGDTPSDTNSSNANDCYVELFDGDDFDPDDDHFKLTGPGEYKNLKDLPGADQDWTDEADSVRVGSGAHVTIWSETGFSGEKSTLDPGSKHPDVDVEPSSLKLSCS